MVKYLVDQIKSGEVHWKRKVRYRVQFSIDFADHQLFYVNICIKSKSTAILPVMLI